MCSSHKGVLEHANDKCRMVTLLVNLVNGHTS